MRALATYVGLKPPRGSWPVGDMCAAIRARCEVVAGSDVAASDATAGKCARTRRAPAKLDDVDDEDKLRDDEDVVVASDDDENEDEEELRGGGGGGGSKKKGKAATAKKGKAPQKNQGPRGFQYKLHPPRTSRPRFYSSVITDSSFFLKLFRAFARSWFPREQAAGF